MASSLTFLAMTESGFDFIWQMLGGPTIMPPARRRGFFFNKTL